MNFNQAEIQDYLLLATSIFAVVCLLSLILDYWIGVKGLRKGSLLIAFVAITLIALPTAENFVFKFGAGEISYDKSAEIAANQAEVVDTSKLIKKQNSEINRKLNTLSESLRINGELVTQIYQLTKDSGDKKGLNQDLDTLLQEQATLTKQVKKVHPSYEIAFDKLVINQVCEKLNRVGEFYFNLSIDGETIKRVPHKEAIKKRKGEYIDLSSYKKQIATLTADDSFNFYGAVYESDGVTMFRSHIKFTTLGEISKKYNFNDLAGKETEVVFDASGADCQATLIFKVNQVATDPPN